MKITVKKKEIPKQLPSESSLLGFVCSPSPSSTQYKMINNYPNSNPSYDQEHDTVEELINLECKSALTRINANYDDTKYLITQLIQKYNVRYCREIGCLCAHIALNYNAWTMKKSKQDYFVLRNLVKLYSVALLTNQGDKERTKLMYRDMSKIKIFKSQESNGGIIKTEIFQKMQDLVQYGYNCIDYHLSPKYKDLKNEENRSKIIKLITRYLKSLLFQFIPPQFSKFVLDLYTQKGQNFKEDELKCIRQYNQRNSFLYPYYQFFAIMISLMHFVAARKNPISIDHFLQICNNAYMGVIQWPIVLGNRYFYDMPYLERRVNQ